MLEFGLLAGGQAVRAQSLYESPNTGETWMHLSSLGKITLERTGPMARATLRLPLFSIPPVVPPASHYLFTLPRDYWPAQTVNETVTFHLVSQDSSFLVPGYRPLNLLVQVEQDGTVYYQPLDEVFIAGATHTTLVEGIWIWPVAGSQPQVCLRSAEVQVAILDQLASATCEKITWWQLASIQNLEMDLRVAIADDIYGLSGLRSASLYWDSATNFQAVPAYLAQLPQLIRLRLYSPRPT